MQLRDYPLVKWRPTWSKIVGDGDTDLTGEIGTLKSASGSRVQPKTCYWIVDVGASSYRRSKRHAGGLPLHSSRGAITCSRKSRASADYQNNFHPTDGASVDRERL